MEKSPAAQTESAVAYLTARPRSPDVIPEKELIRPMGWIDREAVGLIEQHEIGLDVAVRILRK